MFRRRPRHPRDPTGIPNRMVPMQPPPTSRARALVLFPTASHLGRRLTLVLACCTSAVAQVPLQRWTNAAHPTGVAFGFGNGIAAGDFDGDGYVDVYQANSGNLWRIVGGTDWVLARNL